MAEVRIDIEGLDELLREIDRLKDDLHDILGAATDDALALLLGRMQTYPAPRGSYQRTGNLRNSWRKEAVGSGDVLGFVVSDPGIAPYNRYVQSRASQAWMHRGRWQTAEDVAEQEEEKVTAMLRQALAAYLASI